MYICIIESNTSYPREYRVTTSSAMRCAQLYGHCEGGEVVTVHRARSGKVLSRVRWYPVTGYMRVKP